MASASLHGSNLVFNNMPEILVPPPFIRLEWALEAGGLHPTLHFKPGLVEHAELIHA